MQSAAVTGDTPPARRIDYIHWNPELRFQVHRQLSQDAIGAPPAAQEQTSVSGRFGYFS